MNPNDVIQPIVVVVLLGTGVLFAVSVWHLSRALGARIRRWGLPPADDAARTELLEAQAAILGDLESLRREMAELAERMDFAERLLARPRDAQRIGPGQ